MRGPHNTNGSSLVHLRQITDISGKVYVSIACGGAAARAWGLLAKPAAHTPRPTHLLMLYHHVPRCIASATGETAASGCKH